jgi:hypothetical protein
MAKRPWIIVILAVVHALSPVGNLIFNALWVGFSPSDYVYNAFQRQNLVHLWPSMLLPLIAGVAIYLCKKSSFFIFLLCMVGLFIYSLQGYNEHVHNHVLIQLIFSFSMNIAIVSYFLLPAVRQIYMDKSLRWWETEDRFQWDQECHFEDHLQKCTGIIANISKSGLFINADILPMDNTTLKIEFLFMGNTHSLTGTAVLHGPQRKGFGVRFIHGPESKTLVPQIIASLKTEGRLMIARRLDPEGSLWNWIKSLGKSRKGLIPRAKK